MSPAYGYRARIGYTCPVFVGEVFPFDFYRIVPDGVSLLLSTMSVWEGTEEEIKLSAEQSMRAAHEMAEAGADIVVFGGVPVNFAASEHSVEEVVRRMEEDYGVPVTASLLCQNAALKAVGASKVLMMRSSSGTNVQHLEEVERLGCTVLEVLPLSQPVNRSGSLTADETLAQARELIQKPPEADTLHCASPHWPMVANIDALEQEFGITVVTAGQAITWHALRRCGIQDSIKGYGRLLRDL